MPSESQHGRRGHYRGRRRSGRGQRPAQREASSAKPNRANVDQIMRDLRARIAARHGVDLSTVQIEELAARRLDAILAPDGADAALLETLRTGARPAASVPGPQALPGYTFGKTTLYETGGGLVRFLRRLFRPLLRMLFDPDPLVEALRTQATLNAELGRRSAAQASQQAEWNALHYELIKRVVTEGARLGIDVQELAARVEALSAKTDFNERRVRAVEGAAQQARPSRQTPPQGAPAEGAAEPAEGGRRRLRRRRGRRNDADAGESPAAARPQPEPVVTEAMPDQPVPASTPLPAPVEPEPKATAAPVTPPVPVEASPDDPAPAGAMPESAPPAAPAEPEDKPQTRWRQVFSPPPVDKDSSGS